MATGHIIKRYKNSWTVVLFLGHDPETGKKKYQWHTVKGTKRDAERVRTELLHQIDTGTFVKPSKLTLAEFLRQWLRDCAAIRVRPTTAQIYAQWIERQIAPRLGRIPLSELRPSHLQTFYRSALESGRLDGSSGLSARSVLHIHRILHNALATAVVWGLVARNVANSVKPPRAEHKQMKTLDAEGIDRLLEACAGAIYHPLIHLAVYTGLRRSELLGLRWRDVDLDMAVIYVVQVLHCLKGGRIVFHNPKSKSSEREVKLSPVAVIALREHQEQQEIGRMLIGGALTPDDLVFSNPDGSPLLPASVSHAFTKIVSRAGLPGIRLHDLRHTHATILLLQGVHPKAVSDRLGHAKVGITLDTYSHVTPGLQEGAAMKFEEALTTKNR